MPQPLIQLNAKWFQKSSPSSNQNIIEYDSNNTFSFICTGQKVQDAWKQNVKAGRVLEYSCKLKVQEGVGRTAGSSRRNRVIMNHTSFLDCFWSCRDLYYEFRVSSYSHTAFFFLIQYLTVSRTLRGKAAKSEGREYEGGMRITFKYARKGAVSTEVESRTGKKKKKGKKI